MLSGTLIGESLRLNVSLEGVPMQITKLTRFGPLDGLRADQPKIWTMIDFEADEAVAPELAKALAEVLENPPGWYCDFRTESETWVVFSGRVFRYVRGDDPGRAEAAAYARSVGVLESQLDWPE